MNTQTQPISRMTKPQLINLLMRHNAKYADMSPDEARAELNTASVSDLRETAMWTLASSSETH